MLKRDNRIDILRFIATVGIVFAHVASPNWMLQLRSFDVPLMAMLMGASFYLSSDGKNINYLSYVKKRFKRLVIPVWQFLTLFFILILIACFILEIDFIYNLEIMVRSYLLIDGIGYVWIIRVFLVVAVVNPFILSFSNKIERNSNYFISLGLVYVVYLFLVYIGTFILGNLGILYEHLILYSIGYSIISAIGIRLKKLSKNEIYKISIFMLIIWGLLAFVNNFKLTSIAKYPPTTYYLSYAIGISLLFYNLLDYKYLFDLFNNKLVYFVSKNSMWFYLWHIIPVTSIPLVSEFIPLFKNNFILQFLYVFIFSLLVTYIQNELRYKINSIDTLKTN